MMHLLFAALLIGSAPEALAQGTGCVYTGGANFQLEKPRANATGPQFTGCISRTFEALSSSAMIVGSTATNVHFGQIGVSTITGNLTSAGIWISSNVYFSTGTQLTLYGPDAYITTPSSVNGSGFFGDGSALTRLNGANLQDGTVDTAKLKDDSVTTPKIITQAVTGPKIAALAVDSSKLAASSVDNEKLASLAVTGAKIAALTIDSSKLGASSVDSEKLAASAVTGPKIAAAAVDSSKLSTDVAARLSVLEPYVSTVTASLGTVRIDSLTDLLVGDSRPAPNANYIANITQFGSGASAGTLYLEVNGHAGTIIKAVDMYDDAELFKVDSLGGVTASTFTGSGSGLTAIPGSSLVDGAVDTAKLKDDSVTTPKIITQAVTGPKIAALAVDSSKLAASSVDNEKLASLAVTGAKIAALTIDSSKLGASSVDAEKIAASAVNTGKLAADSVTPAKALSDPAWMSKVSTGLVHTYNGNVGVGVTNPGAPFQVSVTGINAAMFSSKRNGQFTNSAGTAGLSAGYDDGSYPGGYLSPAGTSQGLSLYSHNGAAWVGALRIASDGSVGISTMVPQAKFHVAGEILGTSTVTAPSFWGDGAQLTRINGSNIQALSVDSTKIAALTIDSSKLAAASVDAEKIVAGAVGTSKISDGAVTNAKILDSTIAASKLAAGGIFPAIDGSALLNLPAVPAGGGWTEGTGTAYVSDPTDNVGIGITNPTMKLVVQTGTLDSHKIVMTNGTPDARLGVGTTSPAAGLHIYSLSALPSSILSGYSVKALEANINNGSQRYGADATYHGLVDFQYATGRMVLANRYHANPVDIVAGLGTASASTITMINNGITFYPYATTGTEANMFVVAGGSLTLTSLGRMGLGTTSPTSALTISNSARTGLEVKGYSLENAAAGAAQTANHGSIMLGQTLGLRAHIDYDTNQRLYIDNTSANDGIMLRTATSGTAATSTMTWSAAGKLSLNPVNTTGASKTIFEVATSCFTISNLGAVTIGAGTGAPTAGGAVCINASRVLTKCTSAVDASGNCTCP